MLAASRSRFSPEATEGTSLLTLLSPQASFGLLPSRLSDEGVLSWSRSVCSDLQPKDMGLGTCSAAPLPL